jgi:NitT/TauT family transport system ATP-binding protein
MNPALALVRVDKRHPGGVVALQGVDLSIARGEFVSLLGPSGCGKSTALRLLAGLEEPSAGQVLHAGSADATKAADTGFVFQEPTLMPWARVADNVALPLKLLGRPQAEIAQAVAPALASVGLADFARSYPRELSGGMKMRASIARALVTRPGTLLLDEPFAALDEITRFKLNQDLLTLWQRDRFTAVFVTHSVFEAVYLSQRIVVMSARPGRIAQEITIGAPYPRDDAYRASAEYATACVRVSQALQQASGGAHG